MSAGWVAFVLVVAAVITEMFWLAAEQKKAHREQLQAQLNQVGPWAPTTQAEHLRRRPKRSDTKGILAYLARCPDDK